MLCEMTLGSHFVELQQLPLQLSNTFSEMGILNLEKLLYLDDGIFRTLKLCVPYLSNQNMGRATVSDRRLEGYTGKNAVRIKYGCQAALYMERAKFRTFTVYHRHRMPYLPYNKHSIYQYSN